MKLHIDFAEVLRYLGRREQAVDERLTRQIEHMSEMLIASATPRYTYGLFDVTANEEGCRIGEGVLMLPGEDIKGHLGSAVQCALMAATIGAGVDALLTRISKKSMADTIVLDACATVAVEYVCDRVEEELQKYAEKKRLHITHRFSPGYGDLPLQIQPNIAQLLDIHRRIGVSTTDTCLLVPRKSVTAIVGILTGLAPEARTGCEGCKKARRCLYRKKGEHCVS